LDAEAIALPPSTFHTNDAFESHVSTGTCTRTLVPSLNFASTVAGRTSCPRFAIVTCDPAILSTAMSNLQLFMYRPRQNQLRSSPASLSIARKKSDGEVRRRSPAAKDG
jgi:hypothetical protein